MNKTLLEIQDKVLYFTSLVLSELSTLTSAVLQSVQNTRTLQHFLSPLYTKGMLSSLETKVQDRNTTENGTTAKGTQGKVGQGTGMQAKAPEAWKFISQ